VENAATGFFDKSFLGNTYIQCHTRDNGARDPTVQGLPVGVTWHAGQNWYVVVGQEAVASTTEPGTNGAVWQQFPSYGPGAAAPAWVSGMTWVTGGPYITTNPNARNVFLGCYAEAAQPPIQASSPSMFLGGLLDEVRFSPGSTATWVRAVSGSLRTQRGFIVNAIDGGKMTTLGSRPGGDEPNMIWAHTQNATDWWYTVAESNDVLVMGGPGGGYYKTRNNGGRPQFHPARLYIGTSDGSLDTGRWHATINAIEDLAGVTVARGDMFYFASPSIGDPLGVVCTTAGVGGSTAVFGEFGAIAATAPPPPEDMLDGAGTFDSDSGWTVGSGWAITGGQAVGTSSVGLLSRNAGLTTGANYTLTFDYTMSSGVALRMRSNGVDLGSPGNLAASGTYTAGFTAQGPDIGIEASGSAFTGTVDNMTVSPA
jgi:hypothetical protein